MSEAIDFSFDSVDLSTATPIRSDGRPIQWTEEWWAENRNNVVRCVGHRKNGKQCKKAAMHGSTVCAYHGGRAPQVVNRARVRIAEGTEKAAKGLLEMANDKTIPEGVRLSAIKDVLDRGGLGAKQEITVSQKPYEIVLDEIQGGRRAIEPTHSDEDDPDPENEPGSLKARLVTRLMSNEYSDIDP